MMLFHTVRLVGLQCVSVVFHADTHFYFVFLMCIKVSRNNNLLNIVIIWLVLHIIYVLHFITL